MDYFELYDIEESFDIDESLVKSKFYELSKKFHPDFYINESQEKQQEILELSTVNNKAYQVLSNPTKRIEYILIKHNLISEGEKYQLPSDFLMEMMDVNEKLMDLEIERDTEILDSVQKEVEEIEDGLSGELKRYTIDYAERPADEKISDLLKIKDLYYRQKYLWRIRESLKKFQS
jgi:molecular chaperone HscB